jgi:gliding motility-associated-like protein
MSLKDQNIEEMFRTELEDMELPVDNSMWANISKGIASQSAVATTATTTKVLTFLGLGTAAVAVGVAVGLYITSTDELRAEKKNPIETVQVDKPITVAKTTTTETKVTEDQNLVQDIVKPKIIENDKAFTKEEQIKQPRQIIVKSTKEANNVVKDGRNNSWVNNFLTPVKPSSKGITNVTDDTELNTGEEAFISEIIQIPDTIIEVVESDAIIAAIVASPVGGYAPLEVSFANQSETGTVTWDFGDGETSTKPNPTHIFEKFGSYQVKLTIEDENGNFVEDYRLIEVEANSALVEIPNVFTPNNDGDNDYFTIQGKHLETFQLVILTPNGALVFESKSITNAWDGTNKIGEYVKAGPYAVLISAVGVDGKKYEHKGIVNVKY